MDFSPESSCFGKTRHETRADARAAIIQMTAEQRGKPGRLNVYGCPFCCKYHVGHINRDALRRQRGGRRSAFSAA